MLQSVNYHNYFRLMLRKLLKSAFSHFNCFYQFTNCPRIVRTKFVFNNKVENGAGHLLPLVQQEDGQTGVGDDEGRLRWRNWFVSHRVGVDHRAGLALPDVVGLEHDHVVLPATVEIAQSELLGVEADLISEICFKIFQIMMILAKLSYNTVALSVEVRYLRLL